MYYYTLKGIKGVGLGAGLNAHLCISFTKQYFKELAPIFWGVGKVRECGGSGKIKNT